MIRFLFCIAAFAMASAVMAAAAAPAVQPVSAVKPSIAVMDAVSPLYDKDKKRLLTDVLRTELFKTRLFTIIERGVIEKTLKEHELTVSGVAGSDDAIKLGKFIAVEKLLLCSIGRYNGMLAVNVKIIDVNTSLVDYIEDVFVKDDSLLFDALKDTIRKIEVFFTVADDEQNPLKRAEAQRTKWLILGASPDDAAFLVANKADPASYLSARQFDIAFSIRDFIEIVRNGWDMASVHQFFRYGIPYASVRAALGLGIATIDGYRLTFKRANYSFDEYLDAYSNNMTTVDAYRTYREQYRTDRLLLGLGAVADNIPVGTSDFSFIIGQIAWEHYWTSYQRGMFKLSGEMGMNLFNGIIPVPYYQANVYVGGSPFYFKLGVGAHLEAFIGGHVGCYVRAGLEVLDRIEFTAMLVPFGTAPGISYTDLKTRKGEQGYVPINFPYYAAMLTWKL